MDEIDQVLTRGVAQIYPDKKGLADLIAKQKITLYQGFDPSMPSLHLGNYVGLMKLRGFQKLGHKVIFLVGDFTGMIGDPTDKLATRKKLSRAEVEDNYKSWREQIGRILDLSGNNPVEIKFNSHWNDKLTFKDLIETTSNFTVQQMIERDMFQKRLSENEPIYLHEFLYPVAQAIDSVEMDVDLEIGGSDQLFNMLAGRTLMKATKGKEKFVLTTKLLVDKDGRKVGKTTGNAIFLDLPYDKLYAGIMAFPDEVILPSYELLTEVDLEGLEEKIKQNPMDEKKRLAFEIVKLLWGAEKANEAQDSFKKTFQEKEPEFSLSIENKGTLEETLAQLPEVGSLSQAKRLIEQNAIEVDGNVITERGIKIQGGEQIKVGKKLFLKIK
jgi:tyrosyl-tRNA synthetase